MKEFNSIEQEHLKDLERIKNFRLMDDEFMSAVLSDNPEAIELVLQIILDSPTLKVEHSHTQESIYNLFGKDVILDVFCSDDRGTVFNVEIQRSDQGAVPRRARYHASIIDSRVLKPGENFQSLPESYIIFITENDYYGQSRPLYHVDRFVEEVGLPFDDFQHIIYVNGQYKSSDPIGKLIHDFWCTNAEDIYHKVLRDSVSYYKDNEEGSKAMCRELEEMRTNSELKGEEKANRKAIANFLKIGQTVEQIVQLNYPEDLVREVAEEVK